MNDYVICDVDWSVDISWTCVFARNVYKFTWLGYNEINVYLKSDKGYTQWLGSVLVESSYPVNEEVSQDAAESRINAVLPMLAAGTVVFDGNAKDTDLPF